MKVLAFDTTLAACSAAVLEDGRVAARRWEQPGRGHAERLLPMIGDVLLAAGTSYGELQLICVTIGPGTFTGIRIGLAAARGLALASDLPVLGLSTLEAVAAGVAPDGGCAVLAALDARRGQVYVQAFASDRSPLAPPRVLAPQAITTIAPAEPGVVVGTGTELILPYLQRAGASFAPAESPALPDAATFGCRAFSLAERVRPGVAQKPLYLRNPDAKLPSLEG